TLAWSPQLSGMWLFDDGYPNTAPSAGADVLPGRHELRVTAHKDSPPSWAFQVDLNGRIAPDGDGAPFQSGLLSGAGTSTVTVHPFPLQVRLASRVNGTWHVNDAYHTPSDYYAAPAGTFSLMP